MSQALASKLGDEVVAPQVGQISVLSANTTSQTQDLSLCGPATMDMRNADSFPVNGGYAVPGSATVTNNGQSLSGAIGRFCEIYCDGPDIGVIFAANSAVLGGANAASLAAAGVNGAGVCLRIPSATYRTFLLHADARFMSYVSANTTSNVRVCVTSRTG